MVVTLFISFFFSTRYVFIYSFTENSSHGGHSIFFFLFFFTRYAFIYFFTENAYKLIIFLNWR